MSEGFLARWARRKDAVRAAEAASAPRPEGEAVAVTAETVPDSEGAGPLEPTSLPSQAALPAAPGPGAAEASPGEAAPTQLAELPSLDALTPETDLAPFLRTGVPTALRNAALRRMWSLDPAIRDFVSEAREYAYDWNTPGGVPGLGPLLPGDDVQAMLGRLFRDPAAARDAAEPDASTPDTDESPASVPVTAEPGAADADDALAPPQTAQPEAAPVEAAVATAETVPSRPRLRRHGGAMPS